MRRDIARCNRGEIVIYQPDETIETPAQTSGVYIVRAAGGHYTKKIIVK